MSDKEELYELTLTPGAGDTVVTTREEFEALVRQAFEEEGQGHLLTDGTVTIRPQKPFPGVDAVAILIWFGQQIAMEIFKRKVMPVLEAKFEAWWTPKSDDGPASPDEGSSDVS
jgi:hypothetical protein